MIKTAAVALTALLSLGLAAPANAGRYGVDDPRDTSHGSDVLALQVRYGQRELVVKTVHVNLRRDPASGSNATIWIDTDRRDRGPEYVFVSGYFSGTDYVLRHADGFARSTWGKPVEAGDYSLRLDYRRERGTVIVSRAALGGPGAVRVAVRVSGTRSDGTSRGLVDWVGQPRSLSLWVPRG